MDRSSARRRSACARLVVEPLEDRSLLSGYVQTNLVSDIPGLARFTDPNLVNPWGLAASPAGPFWVSDNGTGASTLYDGQGQMVPSGSPLVVGIADTGDRTGSPGAPTGTVFNSGSDFFVSAAGKTASSVFLFATEDGAIAGWNPNVDLTHAVVGVDNSGSDAVYTGLALDSDSAGRNLLYAANFHSGTIDVFDSKFRAVQVSGAFADPNLPAGFAPFNVQNINGRLYVTYAKQDTEKYEDVAGPGNGFIDVFNGDGVLQQRLVSGGPLNSPWGLALAPAAFGEFSGDLLAGNFGDGHINVFDPSSGQFLGELHDAQGNAIVIDHLWGLAFGNGDGAGGTHTLYFNAGIGGQQHGLFGKLTSADAGDADGGEGLSANSYQALIGRPDSGDNYPIPPANGPAPRGEIEVQSGGLPSNLPVRGGLSDLTSALLTVTDGPRAPTAGQSFGALVSANGAGTAAAPPTAPSGTLIAGLGVDTSPTGEDSASAVGRPSALELMRSLRAGPDMQEQTAGTLPAADLTTPTNAGPGSARLPAESSLLVPADRTTDTATQKLDDVTAAQATRAGSYQERVPANVSPTVVDARAHESERGLEALDLLTVLLVTGGACLMLGVVHFTRAANRRDDRKRTLTLCHEHLAPGQ
jgi:uncharacterized protein (TIGR03118 family)